MKVAEEDHFSVYESIGTYSMVGLHIWFMLKVFYLLLPYIDY